MERTLVQREKWTGRCEQTLRFQPGRHIISRENKPIETQSVEVVTSATGSRIAGVAYGTERLGFEMWRFHSVMFLVVLVILKIIRIAGSPVAVIRNAGDRRVPTEIIMIVRVGCLGIRVRIVIFLMVIWSVVVEVRMTTRRCPIPDPMTISRNGTIVALMKTGEANFSSQMIGFGE